MSGVALLLVMWAAAPLTGAIRFGGPPWITLAVIWTLFLVVIFWRLLQRSCMVRDDGLRVRGFWRSYDVPWPQLRGLVVVHYTFAGVAPTGARVFVLFLDRAGRDRGVAVASSRMNQTAMRKAAHVRAWLPEDHYERVTITESVFGEPGEADGEWRPVRGA